MKKITYLAVLIFLIFLFTFVFAVTTTVTLPTTTGNFLISNNGSDLYATSTIYITTANKIGIGTTSPASLFQVSANATATTTVDFGAQAITAKTCFNVRSNAGVATSFYFNGTTMKVEANRCR